MGQVHWTYIRPPDYFARVQFTWMSVGGSEERAGCIEAAVRARLERMWDRVSSASRSLDAEGVAALLGGVRHAFLDAAQKK